MNDEFLELLRCPEDRQRLQLAQPALVAAVNEEIEAGRLRNRAGDTLSRPIDALLVREDGRIGYPVIDDIPILLVDEAVDLDGVKV